MQDNVIYLSIPLHVQSCIYMCDRSWDEFHAPLLPSFFFCKTFSPMAPKLRNRDPVDINDPSTSNQEVYDSPGRGRCRDRGRGHGRGRNRRGRGSRRNEEAPSSFFVSTHE